MDGPFPWRGPFCYTQTMTKNGRIVVDITDPDNVFIHKGNKRKGRTYVIFYTETSTCSA